MRALRTLILAAAFTIAAADPAPGRQYPNQPPPPMPIPPGQLPPPPPIQRPPQPTAAELPKLSGTWSVVGGEKDGQKIPDERLRGVRAVITADTITVVGAGNRPRFVVGYKLNTAVIPNEIDMKIVDGPNKDQVAQGVVTMDSAELMRLCYSPGSQGRPREFRTFAGGSADFLFIFQRPPAGQPGGPQPAAPGQQQNLAPTQGQPNPAPQKPPGGH
jgi:uncharacterized protein (TIGR03067 family)